MVGRCSRWVLGVGRDVCGCVCFKKWIGKGVVYGVGFFLKINDTLHSETEARVRRIKTINKWKKPCHTFFLLPLLPIVPLSYARCT